MDEKIPETQVVRAWKATSFVWEILLSIIVPTTVFALGGRWLDQRWHSSPVFLILGLVLALALAYAIVLRKAKQYLHDQRSSRR